MKRSSMREPSRLSRMNTGRQAASGTRQLVARTIGLILLAAYPAGLSAQAISYPDRGSSTNAVMPTAYQQSIASGENGADNASPSLPLKPRTPGSPAESKPRPGGIQSIAAISGSLAAVLGLFLLVVWLLRRASPSATATLPIEAFEVLGRAALPNRQQVHLLRCGSKLLLVSITATGADTLTEITDPEEVDRMADLCRRPQRGKSTVSFRQALRQAEKRNA
jgi:flagellar biogenesis protein FliO